MLAYDHTNRFLRVAAPMNDLAVATAVAEAAAARFRETLLAGSSASLCAPARYVRTVIANNDDRGISFKGVPR